MGVGGEPEAGRGGGREKQGKGKEGRPRRSVKESALLSKKLLYLN